MGDGRHEGPPLPTPRHDAPTRFEPTDLPAGFADRLAQVCPTVTTEPGDLAEAGRDWWPLSINWAAGGELPARPGVIARPSTTAEVAAVVGLCNSERVPVTAAGGRSGVCGSAVPVHGGVSLDTTGLVGIEAVDDDSLLLQVWSGTYGDDLERDLRANHGVTLGHWPQSMALSTVGGWLACRSAGQYSNRYGKIEDMVMGLEVVLADGSVIRTGGRGPRSASGPDLNQLFVGSEGTLGVITRSTLRVHPLPASEQRSAWSFSSFAEGLAACRRMLRRGATPAVQRLYDHRESKQNFDIEDRHVLIILDEGDPAIVDATMSIAAEECRDGQREDDALVERWLGHRNDVSGLGSAISQGLVVDTCEIAGPWAMLPGLYEAAVEAVKAVPGAWTASAHQSHAYLDGACLYFTFAGQREDDTDGLYREAWDAITNATLERGGALSHHHGIGLNRARFMQEALGDSFHTLVAIKAALDPNGILNPGKLGLPTPFGDGVVWLAGGAV
ncbi:MAG: FAD-binding oxidoreductase [Acidimicrobiales bacterium]